MLRSSRLAALRAEAGVGSRVRTPDPERLSAVLDGAGHSCRRTEEGLFVDASPEEVGDLAAAHGVVLHGLVATADLEQAFFRLMEESGTTPHPGPTQAVRT
jgi:ABC-2 type transport system ATP-binding protein